MKDNVTSIASRITAQAEDRAKQERARKEMDKSLILVILESIASGFVEGEAEAVTTREFLNILEASRLLSSQTRRKLTNTLALSKEIAMIKNNQDVIKGIDIWLKHLE